ncbi:F-box protein At2g32560-like isoform X1 [Ananas comosus]|uniref:F-box protein At2g32560-like isoform X1 n=2 Tax=Ananas comosus TaxID=4615 RepID=A0A6P5FY36_ANACO|nr:F-box protein At2g32560-like isoform X1 [Ananas comosus]
MLLFLISLFSSLLLISPACLLWQFLKNCRSFSTAQFTGHSPSMPTKASNAARKEETAVEAAAENSIILDLPELALELILEKLSPAALLSMASVCSSLRCRCRSDHLWGRHMNQKWRRVIGEESERFMSKEESFKHKGWMNSVPSCICPLSWIKSKYFGGWRSASPSLRFDSTMSCYLALESGKFWFPAQVYNREKGHAGYKLSCYDAQLRYDRRSDTFFARYPPHGRKPAKFEEGIEWDRVRASPVNTCPHDLHVSNCLSDLRPGDHFEIQWRKNKEFPYGWWYGVVGHLESCDGDESHCRCHENDTVILEFRQYMPGSIWRQAIINRKDHREKGNELDGFYGGIRKLHSKEEISMWTRLWPDEILE